MTAGLHGDFLHLGATNALVRPGGATMLGSPVDLARIDRDTYLVAGITDHICPWQSCYRSTQLWRPEPVHSVHQRARRRDGEPARK